MKLTTTSLIATYVLAQQAAATVRFYLAMVGTMLTYLKYNWGDAKSFSNPSNTNNECTQDQKSGFDWSDLPTGDFGSYKGFDFSGFSCSSSDDKRSLISRTGSKVGFSGCEASTNI
jgi:hypothetical protein